MNKKIKLQCGGEDDCKTESCLECQLPVPFQDIWITCAEASCIEVFGVVDLEWLAKEKPEQLRLMQEVMLKMMGKLR